MMMMSTNYWLNGMNECPLPLLSLSLSLSLYLPQKNTQKEKKRKRVFPLRGTEGRGRAGGVLSED